MALSRSSWKLRVHTFVIINQIDFKLDVKKSQLPLSISTQRNYNFIESVKIMCSHIFQLDDKFRVPE